MKSDIRIREATATDLPLLAVLVREYWQFESITGFSSAGLTALLSCLLANPALGRIWVADRDGDLLGYLVAVYVFSLEQQGLMAEIDEFYVVPAARAAGVGAALLRAAEAGLTSAGCVCLQLQLARENSRAREFYRRHGFADRDGYELLDKRLGE